jgi:hypothetical protein
MSNVWILSTRDDLRIALLAAMKEQGKDKLDIMIAADIEDVRMLYSTHYAETRKNGAKWRVSWDRILTWIAACGYEVHITLVKKGSVKHASNQRLSTGNNQGVSTR